MSDDLGCAFADESLIKVRLEVDFDDHQAVPGRPARDLEMLFPNAQVRMRTVDKLLIGVPAVVSGVIVVVTKLAAALIPVMLLVAFWVGVRNEPVQIEQAQLVALGLALFALGSYLVRQYGKFRNRKIKFMKALSENLYFRNLDNDAGVFHNLLDAAEEEEVKEALIAYHFLRLEGRPLAPTELDQRIEDRFYRRWDAVFDFEVADGVAKLRRLGLVDEDGEGRFASIPLEDAQRRLDRTWDDLFDYNPVRASET